jgi:hypothetical protein
MIHVGDIGALIRIVIETDTDISSADSAEIRYQKPSGEIGAWSASVTGDVIEYNTLEGDIDEPGIWHMQGYIDMGSWKGSTSVVKFTMGRSLQ